MTLIDLTNQKFGKLTVIKRVENKGKHTYWLCQCDCGNYKEVRGSHLKSGKIQSCGCLREETFLKNEVGNKYGCLLVLERAENTNDGTAQWLCQCDCGNTIIVRGTLLRNEQVKSCGCLNSKLELKVNEILVNNKEIYSTQFSFPDLLGPNKKPLRFDFAVFKNNSIFCLIECQGEQHYKPIDFFGGKEQFLYQVENDKKKEEYCNDKKIKLVKIPYWDLNNIDKTYLKEKIYGDYN